MPREPESLEDSYRSLQTMHDVAHRKEEELDRRDRHLPLRSYCDYCGRSFVDPETTKRCPDCDRRTGLFFREERDAA